MYRGLYRGRKAPICNTIDPSEALVVALILGVISLEMGPKAPYIGNYALI